jgi:hypothetical protein
MKKVIRITKDGHVRFLYDDRLKSLLNLGVAEVKRASHVEPEMASDGVKWFADLAPVGGPKLSGFDTREEALGAEIEWLNRNRIPEPLST